MSSPSQPGQCPRLETRAHRALLPLAGRPCLEVGAEGRPRLDPAGRGAARCPVAAAWAGSTGCGAGAAGSLYACDPHAVRSPEAPGTAVCDRLQRWQPDGGRGRRSADGMAAASPRLLLRGHVVLL